MIACQLYAFSSRFYSSIYFGGIQLEVWVIPGGSAGKNLPAHAGDSGPDPGLGKIPWKRKWQPTPVFSILGNVMDRGAWQATVHEVTESDTATKQVRGLTQEIKLMQLNI